MIKSAIHKIVKSHLTSFGEYIYEFADLKGLLKGKFDGYSCGISIARKLNDKILDDYRSSVC